MIRTQIYLPKELHQDIKFIALHDGVSLGEVLRKGAEMLRHRKPFLMAYRRAAKKTRKDDLKGFHVLAKKSFNFWNNPEDDIYQQFYSKKK